MKYIETIVCSVYLYSYYGVYTIYVSKYVVCHYGVYRNECTYTRRPAGKPNSLEVFKKSEYMEQ